MAARRPIVIVGNRQSELPAGDTLDTGQLAGFYVEAVGTGASQNIALPASGYDAKDVEVYDNGVRQKPARDYTVSGTTLTGTFTNGGTIILSYGSGAPALRSWRYMNAAATIYVSERILGDTSTAAFTLDLPASPAAGAEVWFKDAARTWATKKLTLNRNGSLIKGVADNLVLDVNAAEVHLVFNAVTNSWEF